LERTISRNRNRSLLASVTLSLGVAAIAFLLLSVLVIRPVMRMESMARHFGGGDLAARLDLRSKDEIGRLATQLNGMAEQIQMYTTSLERLVQERTAELADANTRLVDANRQLDRLAKTDPLTGLYNRRYFMEQLEFEIRRGARTRRQFALIILDVDHFKQYNDSNGHTAGDELLQRLATLLELNLRAVDLVARYGGEEFVVLLFDTGPDDGYAAAKKLQQVVAEQPFPHEQSQANGKLTISVGVAFYPQDSGEARALIDRADQALYAAKGAGRNTVRRWRDVPPAAGIS
jgi:diguanylate cyclase (GGDEF)-like protein